MVDITERAIALAVTQERERCARVCEEMAVDPRVIRPLEDAARRIREVAP
jgi:hypothetical protein